MEKKRIKAIKAWLEPQSIWDIQVFLNFANIYKRFIKGCSKIAASVTLILKTTVPSVSARPVCHRVDKNELYKDDGNEIGGGKINDRLANLSSSTKKISFG